MPASAVTKSSLFPTLQLRDGGARDFFGIAARAAAGVARSGSGAAPGPRFAGQFWAAGAADLPGQFRRQARCRLGCAHPASVPPKQASGRAAKRMAIASSVWLGERCLSFVEAFADPETGSSHAHRVHCLPACRRQSPEFPWAASARRLDCC